MAKEILSVGSTAADLPLMLNSFIEIWDIIVPYLYCIYVPMQLFKFAALISHRR